MKLLAGTVSISVSLKKGKKKKKKEQEEKAVTSNNTLAARIHQLFILL